MFLNMIPDYIAGFAVIMAIYGISAAAYFLGARNNQ